MKYILATLLAIGLCSASLNIDLRFAKFQGSNYIANTYGNITTGFLPYTWSYSTNVSYDNINGNSANYTLSIYDGQGRFRNNSIVVINLTSDNFMTLQEKFSQAAWNQYVLDAGGNQNALIGFGRTLQYDPQVGVCWAR